MKINRFYLVTLMAMLFCACDRGETRYLCFDDVTYLSEFPKNIELEKVSPVDLDLMGCVGLFGNDDFLVFKTMGSDYFWKIYSLPELEEVGSYLRKGNGPNEFRQMPSNEYFYESDSLCAAWTLGERKHYRFNLYQTLKSGELQIDTVSHLSALQGSALTCAAMNDSTYFVTMCYDFNLKRCLLSGDAMKELNHLEALNKAEIYKDINSMAAIRHYEPGHDRVVEGMLYLNQLNLYSVVDSTFTKTICLGDKLTNLLQVDDTSKRRWTKYYGHIVSGDDYFAVLYFNSSRKDFLSGGMDKVDVQFFSWDGLPLLNVTVPYSIESFAIARDRYLYALSVNGETEHLYVYDLGDSLQKL